jgi:hypothetical protein
MKKYISLDALVAEIKTRIETYNKGYANGDDCRADALETFLHDIDTLEVKESLTWEDIRELYIIFAEVDVEIEICKTAKIQAGTIGYYQEVLKRFKAQKGE